MSDSNIPDDPFSRAYCFALDLVRDLNNVREAALGVDPAYRWIGPPAGVCLDDMSIKTVPPSWLTLATSNFEPKDDAELARDLSRFVESWGSGEGEGKLDHLSRTAIQVSALRMGQLVRIGPRGAGSMLAALVNAALEIARTAALCVPRNMQHMRSLISKQLCHFDPCEAYDAIDGEICGAERQPTKTTPQQAIDTAETLHASQEPPDAVPLDEESRLVLCALACSPNWMTRTEIEAACRVNRSTVSDRLRSLVEQGLVRRHPKRQVRGGVAITEKGRERLRKLKHSHREKRVLESTELGTSLL